MGSPTKEQTQRYERMNPKGFLMRCYHNMLSRVVGIQRKEAHYYEGLPLLPKEVFYCWALANGSPFWTLFHTWTAAGRPRRLAPSIDRIRATDGYTLDNMQWMTQAENSAKIRPELHARGERHGNAKLTNQHVRTIRQCAQLVSVAALAKQFNVSTRTIQAVRQRRTWAHVV